MKSHILFIVISAFCVPLLAAAGKLEAQEVPPLTFQEIKDLVRTAVEEKDLPVELPAIIERRSGGADSLFVFVGKCRSTDILGLPHSNIMQIQFSLELMRRHLFDSPRGIQFINSTCDRSEGHLARIVELSGADDDAPDRFDRIAALQREMWTELYGALKEYFQSHGKNFQGLLDTSPSPLTLEDLKSEYGVIPFQRNYAAPSGIQLIGPRGIVVRSVTRFKSRVFEAKNLPKEQWTWQNYELDPANPPNAWFEPGAIYYLQIERSNDVLIRVRSFDTEVTSYNVPLP